MYNENGFGTGAAPYEYVVTPQKSIALRIKKIALILLYVFWGLGLLILGAVVRLIVPLLAFIPLSLWILVFFTWRLTQVTYEYSFFGGMLKVSRILGERSRRLIAEVDLRRLSAVCPCDADGTERINRFSAERVIFAASAKDAPMLVAALWENEKNVRCALYFEADEKALRILRYHNAAAMSSVKRS